MTTILKLGGSVITDKERRETLDGEQLDALADVIAAADLPELVLVHGAGSFAHPHADAHGVTTEAGTADAGAVAEIHGGVKALNQLVLSYLHERDVPAVPVHPFSAAHRDAGAALTLPAGGVGTMVGEGFVPVLHGDVVVHEGKGATILSGDEIIAELAAALGADRVGVCSNVPGVLDDDGAVVERIESFEAVAAALGASDGADVTGGMAGKVRELLALDAPAFVFGAEETGAFLAGRDVGTRID